MKHIYSCLVLIVLLICTGCMNSEMSEKPPKGTLSIGNEQYELVLGTYCWEDGCVDKVGTKELLESHEPIEVKAGHTATLHIDGDFQPSEKTLTMIHGNKEREQPLDDTTFQVPNDAGIYYFNYSVWWMNDKEKHESDGDAQYVFVIEVK